MLGARRGNCCRSIPLTYSGLHSILDRADDVSCLREPGVLRYSNTHVDRQLGKPMKMFGTSVLTGRTFLGPTPSTEYKYI